MRTIVIILSFVSRQVYCWNPSSYPFIPASTDTSHVRDLVIEVQGANKSILDIGCGHGYSTSPYPGCLGIDTNRATIEKAMKTFPNKNFKVEFLPQTNEKYDVVTCMFHLHDIPRFKRRKLIKAATELAIERVVIVDVCPEYKANSEFLKRKPFIKTYFENCREDLKGFIETSLVKGLLHIWIFDKSSPDADIPSELGDLKVLPVANWRGNGAKWDNEENNSFDEMDLIC